MGFSYAKRSKKLYIYEQQEVIESRHRYLRTMKKLREEGKSIVYTDETWVNAHHGHDMVWVDVDGSGGWKQPSGKGERLIVVHAGTRQGWVQGAELVFRSKKSADYHEEMNFDHYIKWWSNSLLPNIPAPSAIVLDNASYHNKQKDT